MADTEQVTEKRCSRCREWKALDAFPVGVGKGGTHCYCRPCLREYVYERRKSPDVQARDKAQKRAYDKATTQLRELHESEFYYLYNAARKEEGLL
jgi:hypothetical protein